MALWAPGAHAQRQKEGWRRIAQCFGLGIDVGWFGEVVVLMAKLLEFIKDGWEASPLLFILLLLGLVQVGDMLWWLIRMVFGL